MKSRAASEVYVLGGFHFAKERVIRAVYIEPLTGDSEEIKERALSLGAWFSKNQRTGFDP
jgi:hypothetical protein